MIKDLTHNKIIADTLTDGFISSVDRVIVPIVEETFPGAIAIQMYEDYLADGFLKDGRWYYPLSVLTDEGVRVLWISWSVDKKRFRAKVPYSFIGEGEVDFRREDSVPEEFSNRLSGRNNYAPSDRIKINIHSTSLDPLFLVGKYSQTFIDEMAKQLTECLSSRMQVAEIHNSVITLQMIFAPNTYMEHTSESVTYRRLRLVDATSAPRDLWIKWRRTDLRGAYSVSDAPAPGMIEFSLGEDVPEKIREKEYRFLLSEDQGKFAAAMTRKNITDWRELVKRAIKRGELVRVSLPELEEPIKEPSIYTEPEKEQNMPELTDSEAKAEVEAPAVDTADGEMDALIASILGGASKEMGAVPMEDSIPEEPESADTSLEDALRKILGQAEPEVSITEDEEELMDTAREAEPELVEEPTPEQIKEASPVMSEEQLRAEIEAKLRLEYESAARAEAEAEAKRLAAEHEKLRLENERLQREAERLEAIRLENEQRLKAEIEMKARAEAREKERLAEAAMLALEEKQRLERENAEMEAKRREAERIAEEERARKEAERLAEEVRKEEEERQRRVAEAEAELERKRAEERKPKSNGYTFTSKRVMFFFRDEVPANITASMENIIRNTLTDSKKTGVPIKIKASVASEKSVCLDFVRIPEEEEELLIKIVQAIGNGGLGIVKARVE